MSNSAAGVTRSKVLTRMLYATLGLFGIPLVVPLQTKWHKGKRMQREDGSLVKASDLDVDFVTTVFPEGAIGDAKSQTVLICVPEGLAGSAPGYIAYAKVYAGCHVALYRTTAKQLVCFCHQSVFDVRRGGVVVAGPAGEALARLPIEVSPDGYLRATGDYSRRSWHG